MQMIYAVNQLDGTVFVSEDFSVFIHCEDSCSEYWGIWSWRYNKHFIVCRHGDAYSAYECKDRTHVKYMMLKMAF